MSTVGFLGLGNMGAAIAGRLIDAGYELIIWNRSPARARLLVNRGARLASSPKEALAADVSFSMLANDEAMVSVFDDNTLRSVAGRTHVVMASISPRLAKRLSRAFHERGAQYVAAPVLGRPELAASGQLNVLAAGPAAAVDRVEPLLGVVGRHVWRLGERASMANTVKAAVNYNIIHALQAIGESTAMVERQGVDAELFAELLSGTLFGGTVYQVYGGIIARRAYSPPGFRVELGRKDLGLAQEVAQDSGVVPATLSVLIDVFDRALDDDELREYDWSAIAEVSRRDLL